MADIKKSEAFSWHQDLCCDLDMCRETKAMSWSNFVTATRNFYLEDDYKNWICCSLYEANWITHVPRTVGYIDMGKCISLTKLLRRSNMSIKEFFSKLKTWVLIGNLSQGWILMKNMALRFSREIERLERQFQISLVLYQTYNNVFYQIFIAHSSIKDTYSSQMECSVVKLYDFCWCLFLRLKGELPQCENNLAPLHLLLCVFNLVYANAVAQGRWNIINPSFNRLVTYCSTSSDNSIPQANFGILRILFKIVHLEDNYLQRKACQEWFEKRIRKFIQIKTLYGNSTNFLDLISGRLFESNVYALTQSYEAFIFGTGGFDERMLLVNPLSSVRYDTMAEKEKLWQKISSSRTLLSGNFVNKENFLPWKKNSKPIDATVTMAAGENLQPLADQIFSEIFIWNIVDDDMITKLEKGLDEMYAIFHKKFPVKCVAKKKFVLAKTLYYYLLEEKMRIDLAHNPNADVTRFLKLELFHSTLIACCVQIAIMTHSFKWKFPWILECFNISVIHFLNIINLMVSWFKDVLTTFVITNLNIIAEKCLGSLVWCNNSTLWKTIAKCSGSMPSWSQAAELTETKKSDETVLETKDNSAYDCFSSRFGKPVRREVFTPTVTNSANSTITSATSAVSSNTSKGENKVGKPTNSSSKPSERNRLMLLILFCRKLYEFAYKRICTMWRQLMPENDNCVQQIWTIFEHTITNNTELMRDRHMDQIIMCAIYMFVQVNAIPDISFTNIISCYLNQPQADSSAYTFVLMQPVVRESDGTEISPPVYSDIIQFYDLIYFPNWRGTETIL